MFNKGGSDYRFLNWDQIDKGPKIFVQVKEWDRLSVLGAALAIALAISFGFSYAMTLGAIVYIFIFILFSVAYCKSWKFVKGLYGTDEKRCPEEDISQRL